MDDSSALLSASQPRSDSYAPTPPFPLPATRRRSVPTASELAVAVKHQTAQDEATAWHWQSVVAFWSGACFAIGSTLFITGAASAMMRPWLKEHGYASWKGRVLVDYAYAIGGCYFTAGAYCGFYEAINDGRDKRRLWSAPSAELEPARYWGTLSYFIGASCFQVAVFAALFGPMLGKLWVTGLEWVPQAIGGLLFSIAAAIELRHNWSSTSAAHVYWVCWLYLYGSLLFFVAAATGLLKALRDPDNEALGMWGVDFPYLIGSTAFLFGAWAQLMMWKAGQFGLMSVGELHRYEWWLDSEEQQALHGENAQGKEEVGEATKVASQVVARIDKAAASSGATEEGGGGEVVKAARDRLQASVRRVMSGNRARRMLPAARCDDQLALAVQLALAATSALNLSFSFVWHRFAKFDVSTLRVPNAERLLEGEELLSDFTGVVAAHGLLLLSAATRFRPSLKPYGELLWLLRGFSILLLAAAGLRLIKYANEASECGEVPEDEPIGGFIFG